MIQIIQQIIKVVPGMTAIRAPRPSSSVNNKASTVLVGVGVAMKLMKLVKMAIQMRVVVVKIPIAIAVTTTAHISSPNGSERNCLRCIVLISTWR